LTYADLVERITGEDFFMLYVSMEDGIRILYPATGRHTLDSHRIVIRPLFDEFSMLARLWSLEEV